MGGREEYQRASQLSTSFHSTSRWVLGHLARNGWLYGIPEEENSQDVVKGESEIEVSSAAKDIAINKGSCSNQNTRKKLKRRKLKLLEIGAINTELLRAATEIQKTHTNKAGSMKGSNMQEEPKYKLDVQAIDLNSMNEGIQQADFLKFPLLHSDPALRYDVLVCSMVINCVTTPEDRGLMLARMFLQLRPGGMCFFTLPRLCLNQSPFITPDLFKKLLTSGVGFELVETKESPKVAFYILRRPVKKSCPPRHLDKWAQKHIVRKGKKYRNEFAVVLAATDFSA
mmetsp:Transcript_24900/g.34805  ORF Transcript_24900/g.34805 Transcript_24900/m.34805 type:complete len:284 (+) Transcript_24900:3-854(+)